MVARTALQQLTWSRNRYGSGQSSYDCAAMLEGRVIAYINDVPAGWSVRLCCVKYETRGAHEVYEAYDQARAAVELWVRGLDND